MARRRAPAGQEGCDVLRVQVLLIDAAGEPRDPGVFVTATPEWRVGEDDAAVAKSDRLREHVSRYKRKPSWLYAFPTLFALVFIEIVAEEWPNSAPRRPGCILARLATLERAGGLRRRKRENDRVHPRRDDRACTRSHPKLQLLREGDPPEATRDDALARARCERPDGDNPARRTNLLHGHR